MNTQEPLCSQADIICGRDLLPIRLETTKSLEHACDLIVHCFSRALSPRDRRRALDDRSPPGSNLSIIGEKFLHNGRFRFADYEGDDC